MAHDVWPNRAGQSATPIHALVCCNHQPIGAATATIKAAEYAHNTQTSTATGLLSFEASLGYRPPLFPYLEQEIAVPSIQHTAVIASETSPGPPSRMSHLSTATRFLTCLPERTIPVIVCQDGALLGGLLQAGSSFHWSFPYAENLHPSHSSVEAAHLDKNPPSLPHLPNQTVHHQPLPTPR